MSRTFPLRDFTVLDGSERRPIVDFGRDSGGVTIALLFDASGSMESRLTNAREAGNHLLSWLDATRDEAAVFTFDTQLDEIVPFTVGLKQLPRSLSDVLPFGATSLHDAIAQTAERVGRREGRRRAVAVLHRWQRHGEPSKAERGVSDRQCDRRAGLHFWHRAVDR